MKKRFKQLKRKERKKIALQIMLAVGVLFLVCGLLIARSKRQAAEKRAVTAQEQKLK